MANVIAYGEDPLTLWALTVRLGHVLNELHDPTPASDVLVVYRPSFGRGGAAKHSRAGRRAEFGEFDAILRSDSAVYLVEAKWHRSPEIQGGAAILRDEQTTRHRILRWLLNEWREQRATSWSEFRPRAVTAFEHDFPGMTLASDGRRLAGSLEYLMRLLGSRTEAIRDVLLVLCPEGQDVEIARAPDGFTVVRVPFAPLTASTDYFRLQ